MSNKELFAELEHVLPRMRWCRSATSSEVQAKHSTRAWKGAGNGWEVAIVEMNVTDGTKVFDGVARRGELSLHLHGRLAQLAVETAEKLTPLAS